MFVGLPCSDVGGMGSDVNKWGQGSQVYIFFT